MATLNPGDEVIIPRPYWSAIPKWWQSAAAPRPFADTSIDNGFKLTPAVLEKAITPKTKWLADEFAVEPVGRRLHGSRIAGARRRRVEAPAMSGR